MTKNYRYELGHFLDPYPNDASTEFIDFYEKDTPCIICRVQSNRMSLRYTKGDKTAAQISLAPSLKNMS